MRKINRLAAVCGLAWLQSVSAWGQPALPEQTTNPQMVLEAPKRWIRELVVQQAASRKKVKDHCDVDLVKADNALLKTHSDNPAQVSQAAEAALAAQDRCDEAKEALSSWDKKAADASKLLRLLSQDFNQCSAAADSCVAQRLGAQVLALDKPDTAGVQSLVVAASTAQKRVAEQKAAVADAYAKGDVAAAAALAASAPGAFASAGADAGAGAGSGATARSTATATGRPSASAHASVAFEEAAAARRAASQAQQASNRFVGAALKLLKDCSEATLDQCDKDAKPETLAQARLSEKVMNLALEESKVRYEKAKLAGYGVDASQYPGDEATRAVRFLRALDDNPDAKSLVGGNDGYKVTAGKGGAGLAIKIVNERAGSDFFRHGSMVISTPAEAGDSTLYKSADGLAKASTLELANVFIRGRGLNSSATDRPLLHQSGVALTLGHQPTTYVETGALATELKRTLVPWSVSVFSAFSVLLDKDADAKSNTRSNASYAKLSWQRQVEAGDTTITCPVAVNDGNFRPQSVVQCSQGPFGAPKLVSAWQLHYEYRVKNEAWPDFSVALKHNVTEKSNKAVTNINVPVYLLKQTDDAKSPVNAGINFGWSSKGGNNFGIFLGAPLSLYAFDR